MSKKFLLHAKKDLIQIYILYFKFVDVLYIK